MVHLKMAPREIPDLETITFFFVPMVGECFMGSIDGWVGDLAGGIPTDLFRGIFRGYGFPPNDSQVPPPILFSPDLVRFETFLV